MDKPKHVALSASRIKTLEKCSWSYWCSYVLKLPEKSNDGASRGNVVHLVLEMLAKKNRKSYVDKILESKDIFCIASINSSLLCFFRLNFCNSSGLKIPGLSVPDEMCKADFFSFFIAYNGQNTVRLVHKGKKNAYFFGS